MAMLIRKPRKISEEATKRFRDRLKANNQKRNSLIEQRSILKEKENVLVSR